MADEEIHYISHLDLKEEHADVSNGEETFCNNISIMIKYQSCPDIANDLHPVEHWDGRRVQMCN